VPPSAQAPAEPRRSVPREVRAFAPGRVNLIGEHTDYNGGLALPFAIAQGVTVEARTEPSDLRIWADALDLGEHDEFALADPRARTASAAPPTGWRAFVRGIAAELGALGVGLPATSLRIEGDVPRGSGLSSSAALEVALALALLGLAGEELERRELARLCARVEREWAGAHTGLLDQLASLFGERDAALRIDFATLEIEPVPLVLDGGWRLAIVDSGERRELAASGYNERRAECERACELLGVATLSQARAERLGELPETLQRRARHVLEENARVRATAKALRAGDLTGVGALLSASHTSLRDLYECSTPAVEATVSRLHEAGAAGARMVGGGFGGSVLGLFPPARQPPGDAREVSPSRGARLLSR
jgi:galactokinase